MISRTHLALLFAVFFFKIFSQSKSNYNLLWKIEGNGLKKASYLFGTMHVRDSRAFDFSDSVMLALDECEAYAMEIHPDTMLMDVFNGLFNDSTSRDFILKDYLSKNKYDKLDSEFQEQYGYSIEKLKVKNPYVIKTLLNKSKSSTDQQVTFVDAYLLGISKTLNKKIYGLEKTKDQLDFFNSLSKKRLEDELEDILNDDSDKSTSLERLTNIYAGGNIYDIEKEVNSYGLYDSALIKRNYVMVKSMTSIMNLHSLFTAVGVAHLPGKEGVIQLLKDKGYKVTPVAATFTGVSKKYTIDHTKITWQKYTDTANGFSIESPGPFINVKIFPGLETKIYMDLTNITTYGYYLINMAGSGSQINEKSILDNIVNNYRSAEKYNVSKVKYLNKDGISMREITMKVGKTNSMRLRVFMKNSILYGLLVSGESSKIYSLQSEKFFDSYKALEVKIKKDPKWITFNKPEGAFSVSVPLEPKEISQDIPVDDGTERTYKLKMYMSTNFSSMTNYLIRYNDFPERTYLDQKERVFEGTINQIAKENKLLSGPDTIWKDGHEGRKFVCMLQGKYKTEGQIFTRGNRTYLLLRQNMVQNSNKDIDDAFFESFTFEPYKKTEEYLLQPEGEEYQVTLPLNPLVIPDTVNSPNSYLENIVDYYATNPNSGGLYQFEMADISEYFSTKNLTEYYQKFIKGMLGFTDSLITSDSVMVDGFYAREYIYSPWKEDNPRRARVWIAGKKLFYMNAYIGKDELFSDQSNLFFNSFKWSGKKEMKEIAAPKAEKILTDLLSTDKAVYKKALGAMDYYEFEKSDLQSLLKALSLSYKDDSLPGGAKGLIIDAIADIKDTTAFGQLVKEFHSSKNDNETKLSILLAIPKIDLLKGWPIYLDIVRSEKNLKTKYRDWQLLSPLRDSLELTRERFDEVIELINNESYRTGLLGIASSIVLKDSAKIFTKKYFSELTKYAHADLDRYFKDLKDTSNTDYHTESFYYLGLMEQYDDKELLDNYTLRMMSDEFKQDYYQVRAMEIRIKKNLPIEKSLLNKRLESMNHRLALLQAFEASGQLEKVNKKYLSPEALGKLAVYNYVSEDEYYPDKMKLIGEVQEGDRSYKVYTFSFEGDEINYLAIAGPFNKNGKVKMTELMASTSYEQKEKDWKTQALALVPAIH